MRSGVGVKSYLLTTIYKVQNSHSASVFHPRYGTPRIYSRKLSRNLFCFPRSNVEECQLVFDENLLLVSFKHESHNCLLLTALPFTYIYDV